MIMWPQATALQASLVRESLLAPLSLVRESSGWCENPLSRLIPWLVRESSGWCENPFSHPLPRESLPANSPQNKKHSQLRFLRPQVNHAAKGRSLAGWRDALLPL